VDAVLHYLPGKDGAGAAVSRAAARFCSGGFCTGSVCFYRSDGAVQCAATTARSTPVEPFQDEPEIPGTGVPGPSGRA
jgi:hypothetical protein